VRSASAGVARSLELASIHVPEAYFVVSEGPDVGRRHRIGPTCTLGRTSFADIVVEDGSVSRRHAEVFLLEGDFWVADLGSTNTTHVNGRAIGAAPHKLEHDDRLRVGAIELRFEQSRRS
jgi:pSer/pThr/pTyr-binding forkhead associated (FHA) protein